MGTCGHLGEQVYFPSAPNMFAFLRVAGLRLNTVASDPLRGDAFMLRLVAHFVADVGAGIPPAGTLSAKVHDLR